MKNPKTLALPRPTRGILSAIARERGTHKNNVIRWYYLGEPSTVRRVAELEKARNKGRRDAAVALAKALGADI